MLLIRALVSFNLCFFALVNLSLASALAFQPQVRNPTIALSFLLTLGLVADFAADFGAESVADSVDSATDSVAD